MKIEEISAQYETHMGDDLLVVNAARQSFDKQKKIYDEKDASLIHFLATGMRTKEWDVFLQEILMFGVEYRNTEEHQHEKIKQDLKQRLLQYKRQAIHFAPFAHPHLTIRIRLPIFLARQFVKHQIGGTWSEESRRYMSSEISYFFEPELHGRPDDIKQGSDKDSHPRTDFLIESMMSHTSNGNDMYNHLVNVEKVAPEEARQIVSQNAMTGVTWTGSLLFWSRVVTQRVDSHAQKAANVLAKIIDDIARPLYPESWQALVGDLPDNT